MDCLETRANSIQWISRVDLAQEWDCGVSLNQCTMACFTCGSNMLVCFCTGIESYQLLTNSAAGAGAAGGGGAAAAGAAQ
jgi:hypothetical protein